ncbi:hypothetical protein BN946_scf184910.g15 [Trametes cinnabarina]|uniref:DNA-directed RNA polymerase III subunit RPC6 n=1 Tax=Pycnoporus cinnabarinus TaxID=5643 RepID=A0A060SBB0_PYCCI|nr:hypothetical protein BN946_scf184910.g15 [Trametes cinnabarina]
MSGRKLNPLEQKLHQAALADPKKTLTQKECEALIPDPAARTGALNFLLGTGLLKALKDTKGAVSFRAVMKKELDVRSKKDMSGEEAMILSYIQAAGNEGMLRPNVIRCVGAERVHAGIWTKHLKAKTELHQTVIDRCLKSLTQKQLIKAVKSVKFPTRKIYMLAHLEPSVEMTGGPWYTDNELDTEFIKLLCSACLRFIRDRSAPKRKGSDDSSSSTLLYPISAAPSYPTAQQILGFLSKSRITETELNVEHVEMLLNVLVLDGEIERVPAFGAAMWDTSEDPVAGASDGEDGERSKRRRKRKSREDDESPKRKRKRSKRSRSSSESDSESESDSGSESERERKKRKKKRRSRDESSDSESGDEKDRKSKKKSKKRSRDASEDDGEDVEMIDEEEKSKSKSKSRNKSKSQSRNSKRRKHDSDSSGSGSDTESSSDSDSDSDRDRHSRSRSKSKSNSSKSKSKSKSKRSRSSSPVAHDFAAAHEDYGAGGGAYVYRAVRQEHAAGGLSQSPCVRCPTFDFCKPGGPVNPQECTYYGGWLVAAEVGKE